MTAFKKVALVGRGQLGSAVLSELVKGGFEVTVLGRSRKTEEDLPAHVRVLAVDYADKQSLVKALSGQDAVVSTVASEARPAQKLMIDAAIETGVRRFIPTDFGSLTTHPAASDFPHHIDMVDIQQYLKSKSHDIEHTIFSIGGFTEFIINYNLFFDWEHKTAEVWADGSSGISTTSLHGIGRAIVGALKNPEPTKNKNLFLHELVVTQSQLISLAKKYSPGADWTITQVSDPLAEFYRLEAIAKEDPSFPNTMDFLKATVMSGKFQAYYQEVDNELVGLPLLSEKDFELKFAQVYGNK
ncbi:hypothetical protein KVR01_007987 [Diaporthe batatas]|uniref:uncharacterized protein n=1 Tax=Diaporthe batatas TaxID=748121 RepID=UPI001D052DC9|nr:uncharacterized protein KVR01_007987 [Diaporthe batatas]KAG8162222.1 hypothetical protein KVR01_007987 [Diaporthe batatas]